MLFSLFSVVYKSYDFCDNQKDSLAHINSKAGKDDTEESPTKVLSCL